MFEGPRWYQSPMLSSFVKLATQQHITDYHMHATNVFQCGTFQSLAKRKFSRNQHEENAQDQMTSGEIPSHVMLLIEIQPIIFTRRFIMLEVNIDMLYT